MKLTYKQIAVFGQVKVDLYTTTSRLAKYTTLLELYKQGWWVTDRTGAIITLVKPKPMLKYGFCCVCRRISTSINLDALDEQTKPIAEAKYATYKKILESKEPYHKLKNIEKDNDVRLSILPSENTNLLRQTSGRTDSKVQGKNKRPRFHGKKKKDSVKIIP